MGKICKVKLATRNLKTFKIPHWKFMINSLEDQTDQELVKVKQN